MDIQVDIKRKDLVALNLYIFPRLRGTWITLAVLAVGIFTYIVLTKKPTTTYDFATAAFASGVHEAAAVITFLSPGLRFFHQGQFEGRRKKISPHLGRAPDEPLEPALGGFYDRLRAVLCQPAVRDGQWELLDCTPAWDGNGTSDCVVAFAWQGAGGERLLVTVNYADNQSQCYVRLPFADLGTASWRLTDLLGDTTFDRDGRGLRSRGLYLDVPRWYAAVFLVTCLSFSGPPS